MESKNMKILLQLVERLSQGNMPWQVRARGVGIGEITVRFGQEIDRDSQGEWEYLAKLEFSGNTISYGGLVIYEEQVFQLLDYFIAQ